MISGAERAGEATRKMRRMEVAVVDFILDSREAGGTAALPRLTSPLYLHRQWVSMEAL